MSNNLTTATTQRPGLMAYDVLRGEVDRVFNDWLGELGVSGFGGAELAFFNPRLDVKENGQHLVVSVELPGMEAKDVEVELDRNFLLVKGKKEEMKEEKGDTMYRRERRFGSFERQVPLPWDVDPSTKVDASFKHGVLTVLVPKPKELATARKKIAVKSV